MRAYCIGNFGSVDGVVLDPALTLPRPKAASGLALAKSLQVIDGIRSRKSCSHQTPRWSETDSNPRSLSEGKCWKGRTSRRGGSFFRGDRGFESVFLQRGV